MKARFVERLISADFSPHAMIFRERHHSDCDGAAPMLIPFSRRLTMRCHAAERAILISCAPLLRQLRHALRRRSGFAACHAVSASAAFVEPPVL